MHAVYQTGLYKKAKELREEINKLYGIENPIAKKRISSNTLELVLQVAKDIKNGSDFEKSKDIITTILTLSEILGKNLEETSKLLNNFQSEIENFLSNRKKVLILTTQLGHGHIAAAKGLKEGIERKYGLNYQVNIVDFVEDSSEFVDEASKALYNNSIKYAPALYKLFFEGFDTKLNMKILNLINYPILKDNIKKLLTKQNPDIIVSTFPIWDYTVNSIWKELKPEGKFVSIITDSIRIHKSWITADINYHIVPNEDSADVLRKMKVTEDKIKVLGFPIKLAFSEKIDQEKILKKIGLKKDKCTILFVVNTGAQKKTEKLINEFIENSKDNYQGIIITGKNKKLKEKLDKEYQHENIKIIGWTNEIEKYMKSADIIITKAGGATVMECIGAKKPLIINQIIPGQEEGNATLIEKRKLGIILPKNKKSLSEAIKDIMSDYPAYKKRLEEVSRPKASLEIAEFLDQII